MELYHLILMIVVFAATSVIGVVTGSNSLITVPIMFQFGVAPKVALATNMFGLTFMNIGATLPFVRSGSLRVDKLKPLIIITLVGSSIGALLVGWLKSEWIPVIVVVSMVLVSLFIIFNGTGAKSAGRFDSPIITFALTFFLGIYGGVYSGGYVTILTAVLAAFYGFTFTEAIAGTKLINIFSSGIATVIFAVQGLIDYKLGVILAATMFVFANLGARIVTRLSDVWLRRIFLSAVILLAIKTLFDYTLN
ncbi:MAG: sulfite exporter TauE/SafE family protein [Pyrinomonadaceae bacterium]